MTDKYEAPQVRELGSVSELTEGLDKIGSVADFLTPAIPLLDGEVQPDA
jgi:hypothetical protein